MRSVLEFCTEKIPTEYCGKWKELIRMCWNRDPDIIRRILLNVTARCEIESNKNLPILNRGEGGLGGNSNAHNKQIRFQQINSPLNVILLDVLDSNDGKETWSQKELFDLIQAFTEEFNDYLREDRLVYGRLSIYPDY